MDWLIFNGETQLKYFYSNKHSYWLGIEINSPFVQVWYFISYHACSIKMLLSLGFFAFKITAPMTDCHSLKPAKTAKPATGTNADKRHPFQAVFMVQNQTHRTFLGHLHFITSAEIFQMICLFYSSSHCRSHLASSFSVSQAFTIQLVVKVYWERSQIRGRCAFNWK